MTARPPRPSHRQAGQVVSPSALRVEENESKSSVFGEVRPSSTRVGVVKVRKTVFNTGNFLDFTLFVLTTVFTFQMSGSEPSSSVEQPSVPSPVSSDQGQPIDRENTSWAKWKNWTNAVLGRFDDPTMDEYFRLVDDQNEERDIKRCEAGRDWMLKWSPTIRFMQEKIRKLGGDLNKDNIKCMKCTALKGSGFDPDYGIQLCANRSKKRSLIEDCMAHGEGFLLTPYD